MDNFLDIFQNLIKTVHSTRNTTEELLRKLKSDVGMSVREM